MKTNSPKHIHRNADYLIRGLDKARNPVGTDGIGKPFEGRRVDWKALLALTVGRKQHEARV